VSALLWAAFLADLRDDFQAGRHAADWPLNCVILVDNADAAGDSSFLDELVTARRRHAAHSPADPDPLTVLAASRGALSARVTPPGETIPLADQAVIKISAAQGQVTARNVLGELGDLSASNAVPGAAGNFGFDPVAGNPAGRDFPVLELTPGGRLKLLGVYPLPAPAAGQ
jgi:hypothetical protein